MSSLTALVSTHGALRIGDKDQAVLALQIALQAAGYKVAADSDFGPGTDGAVRQFQRQHGLASDGIVGPVTAALLDAPHAAMVETALPLVRASGWPHDDSASLLAFYGKPWEDAALLVHVDVPFAMTYEGTPVHSIRFHHKAADALSRVLHRIAEASETDPSVLKHVSKFSGSYNYRPVRGSSRLSCHAFGVAIDFDAEHLPMGVRVADGVVHPAVVKAFDDVGFFWGNRYKGRPDPMHWAAAHE